MHTEHLRNVRLVWVATGWLVFAAATSLTMLVLASLELIGTSIATDLLWAVVSVAVGSWIGGFFIGTRAIEAPILHGVAIGLSTVVVWFVVNLVIGITFRYVEWQALAPTLTAGLLIVQIAAASGGAWVGHRLALRGGTDAGT